MYGQNCRQWTMRGSWGDGLKGSQIGDWIPSESEEVRGTQCDNFCDGNDTQLNKQLSILGDLPFFCTRSNIQHQSTLVHIR